MRRLTLALAGALVVGLVFASGACLTATQVTVFVGTDVACPKSGDPAGELVDVVVLGATPDAVDKTPFSGTTDACRHVTSASKVPGPNDVGSLVFVPRGAKDADTEVLVVAGLSYPNGKLLRASDCLDEVQAHKMQPGDPCIVARRRLGFIPHAKIELVVELEASCAGRVCDESSTCYKGKCVPADCAVTDGVCLLPQEGGQGGAGGTVGVSVSTQQSNVSASLSAGVTSVTTDVGTAVTSASSTLSTGVGAASSTGTGLPGCGCAGDTDCTGCPVGSTPQCTASSCTCVCSNNVVKPCMSTLISANCMCAAITCP